MNTQKELRPILINLTGDFQFPEGCKDIDGDSSLKELSSFLGALRANTAFKEPGFLGAIARLVRSLKTRRDSKLKLKITTTLEGGKIIHLFEIAEF